MNNKSKQLCIKFILHYKLHKWSLRRAFEKESRPTEIYFSECISCTMKPVIFVHIYTFSRCFHPKWLKKRVTKAVCQGGWFLLQAWNLMLDCIHFLMGFECVFVYIRLWICKKKKSSDLLKSESQCKHFFQPLIFYAIRIMQIA